MSYKISKELFEAVKNCNDYLELVVISDRFVTGVGRSSLSKIDINSFFFKCKEWAYDNWAYNILSYRENISRYGCIITSIDNCIESNGWTEQIECRHFEANSEQQAVFDACQWILDNKDK